jgi:Putative beta-barrel porin-2, OmpL-like. bbp2
MKFNKWTLGLAAVGVVSLTSAARADESKISQVQTALSNTTLSGYVDVSAQFNPNGGGGAPNYEFGNKANGINLNVVDIALDKPLDESPWASGYHVEVWLGPDASSLGTSQAPYSGQNIGINSPAAIRQAYIALRTPVGNGIDWKIGVFDTIVGYESTTSGNNPNYSRSFGYNIEPTTHTGILGTYKINDIATVQAGVADTSYAGFGAYSAGYNNQMYLPTVMGGVTLTAPDSFGWAKGATLSFDIINTSGNLNQAAGNNPPERNGNGATTYYAGVTLPTPIAALKFGAAFDYLNARDISANTWVGAVYSTYQFNDKLSLNLRAEYLDGGGNTTDGTTLNGGAYQSGNPPFGTQTGGDQQAQELTATVQYSLWANVLTRLEVRWDHVNHGNGYDNNQFSGYRQDAFLLAAQAIYTF